MQLTVLFLRELREQQQVEQSTFLVDGATHLASVLDRLSLNFRYKNTEVGRASNVFLRGKSGERLRFKYVQQRVARRSRIVAPNLRCLVESMLNLTRPLL